MLVNSLVFWREKIFYSLFCGERARGYLQIKNQRTTYRYFHPSLCREKKKERDRQIAITARGCYEHRATIDIEIRREREREREAEEVRNKML